MLNAIQMNTALKDYLLDNIVSHTKRGIRETTDYVYGKKCQVDRI